MKENTMNKATKTILAIFTVGILGCGVLCQQTQAQGPITGAIQFFGGATASGASDGGPITIAFSNPWDVLQGTGDYAGIPFGTDATFSDFTFTGDGIAATLSGPVVPLWIFADGGLTYSFDLLQLTNGHSESGSMSFSGIGVAHITGFSDTIASFGLQGSGTGFNFQLSSSTTAAVPETGTSIVLALGLLFVAVETRRRKRLAA
jgi:hypothetical protein